jgi:heat shock protein HslJ
MKIQITPIGNQFSAVITFGGSTLTYRAIGATEKEAACNAIDKMNKDA